MGTNPKIGTYEYFERLYEVEDKHWWSRGMRAVAAGILDGQYRGARNLDVLDAGCGTGVNLSWLERYTPDRGAVGSDISRVAIDFCRKRGHPFLSQASVLQLPFKEAAFDLVVCNDVIQHLRGSGSDVVAMREMFRVLRPGGCLFVRTNSRQGLGHESARETEDYRRYDVATLRERAERSGFCVLKVTHANTVMSVVPTIRRRLKRNTDHHQHNDHGLSIRLLPASLRGLNAALYLVLRAEAWLLSKPSVRSPFGQTIFLLAQKPEAARERSADHTIPNPNDAL